MAPGTPSRLRTGALVAWLSLGSCTDQVASASASSVASRISAGRRVRAAAGAARRARLPGGRFRRSRLRSIAGMSPPQPSTATRRCSASAVVSLVLHHGDADVANAGIAAVGLVAREIAAGHDAQARLAPEPQRGGLIAALRRDVEPEKEAAGRPPIAVAVADDLVGEIEFLRVEPAVLLDMRLVAVGGDRDPLRRHRHLRRRDVAQLEEAREECAVAGGEADAQPRQVRALRQRLELDHVGEIRAGRFEHARRARAGCRFRNSIRR